MTGRTWMWTVALGMVLSATSAWSQEQFTVSGSVVGPDGAAIAGATVRAPYLTDLPDRHYVWAETETAQDGSFALQVETPPGGRGDFMLIASKDGYAIGVIETKPDEPARITLSDEPATLRGSVANAAGEPLAGVTVTPQWLSYPVPGGMGPAFKGFHVGYAGCPLSNTTGADGSFTIDSLSPGSRATVAAEADGYVDQEARAEIGPEGADVSIVLQREARISGRVLRDGQPVAGVRVSASSAAQSGTSATSDEAGYSIGGLPEGVYSVFTAKWHDGEISRTVTDIGVGVGEHVEGVDVELVEGGVVEGLVRDEETGEPLPNVGVNVRHADQPKYSHGFRTDADGRYEARVAPGEVTVQLSRSQGRSSVSVVVLNGERVTASDLLGQAPPETRVLVTDEAGQPVSGAQVWLADSTRSYPPQEPEVTDATGQVVLARGPTMARPQTPMVFACLPDADLAALVPLREDGEMTVLQLTEAGYLTVRVLGPDGAPLGMGGATVTVTRIGEADVNLPPHYATDEHGVLRIGPLPVGRPLVVRLDPVTNAMAPAPWTGGVAGMLARGQTAQLHALELDPAGRSVSGVVTDVDEAPVDAQVFSRDTTTLQHASAPTDGQGGFTLTGLRCRDTVTLVAHTDDGKLACGVVCDPDLGLDVELVVEPVGIIEGIVYAADGKPCPKATVEVSSMHFAWPAELPAGLVGRHTTATDERGYWRIEGLVPGLEYRVSSYDGSGRSYGRAESFIALPGPMPVPIDMYLITR